MGAENVVRSCLGLPLRLPETDDAEVGVNSLKEAACRPGILAPGGVDLVSAGFGQWHHVEHAA